MNKLLTGASVAAGLMTVLSGCSDTFDPSSTSDGEGLILVSVGLDKDVSAPRNLPKSAASRSAEIEASDLKLRLSSTDGNFAQEWLNMDEMGSSVKCPVGAYLFEAYYGEEGAEGFDAPYYYGSQSLSVFEDRTTPVDVTAKLGNAMVSVVYSEAVRSYFTKCDGTVVSSTGREFAYGLDETRAVYVTPGSVTINVDVTKQSGAGAKLSPMTFVAEACHHYTVTFDISGDGAGKGELTVTFNSDLEEREVEIDLSDEILLAPAPTVSAEGFTSAVPMTFVEGTKGENLRATIVAQAGVGTVVMTTSSASLLQQGWPAEVDFASADASTLAKLRELGLEFIGLEGVKTQMARLDFSNVVSHIAYVDGGSNMTEINFVAKDKVMKSSEPVALQIEIEKLGLDIVSVEALELDATELTFELAYNGADVNDVVFQLRNDRNTWSNVDPVSVTALSRAGETYRVVLPVPAEGAVEFRALCGDLSTEGRIVKRSSVRLTVDENDVFATHATLGVSDSEAKLYLSENGTDFVEYAFTAGAGKTLAVNGLKAGTTYTARAQVDDVVSPVISFTTETAAQIPNGNMDAEVATERLGRATVFSSYIYKNVYAAPWGTNNEMTTKDGAYFVYVRPNTAYPTTDSHSGSATVLRTSAWGSGTTAAGAISVLYHIDAGMLHLGANRGTRPDGYGDVTGCLSTDDLDCGMEFGSRPSSLSFWYKYSPKNSADRGYAEIWVKDAAGNTLAGNVMDLGAVGEYTQVTLPLTYAAGAPKGAKIYVKFLSSNDEQFLTNNDSNLAYQLATSGNPHYGSVLYVDDIELNY